MTTRPNPFKPVLNQTFHASARTALSQNVDQHTGERSQVLRTSRLDMHWEAGELRIRCQSSRVVLAGTRSQSGARR
ncbi:hypothetical protein [Acidovorax sp. NCPPB 3576]|uniref:hypothetical protein n=1 Tax=Acidovorax sp. NCPPB 3576 TaxID=2940488 RepID=UPI00234AFCA2|nr:hypothetical protein [Acidovorax sp. NCPPB 3576]WCM88825.1 hypothetical protein M5C98_01860 [Acidovorax sp. NCPPB 3576]